MLWFGSVDWWGLGLDTAGTALEWAFQSLIEQPELWDAKPRFGLSDSRPGVRGAVASDITLAGTRLRGSRCSIRFSHFPVLVGDTVQMATRMHGALVLLASLSSASAQAYASLWPSFDGAGGSYFSNQTGVPTSAIGGVVTPSSTTYALPR